jgi:8-oxo-dGTP pyrophosphatase MutT (NUDIX family)
MKSVSASEAFCYYVGMNILSTIGQQDPSIHYSDRPTVKVVIKNDDKILLIDEGILPGGGVEPNESDQEAITREIQEEIGATIKDLRDIGTVLQYRNLISKRYLVNGYTASLETIGGSTNPQSEREERLTTQWLSIEDALAYVARSIEEAKLDPLDDAAADQGRLYNLLTTLEFLKAVA